MNKKIFLLTPKDGLSDNDNPWIPWYDKCFGLVIRAVDEQEARDLAHDNEWINPKYSDCIEIDSNGESEIILMDIRRA